MFEEVEVKVLDEFFEKHGFIKHKSYYFKHCYSYLGRRIGFPVKKTHHTYLKKNRVKKDGEEFLIDIEAIKEDIEKISDKTKLMKTNKNVFQFRTVFFKNHVYDILSKFPKITLSNMEEITINFLEESVPVIDTRNDSNKKCFVYFKLFDKFYSVEINGDSFSYKTLLDVEPDELEFIIYSIKSTTEDDDDLSASIYNYTYWYSMYIEKIKNLESTIKTLLRSRLVSDSAKVQASS